MELSAFLRVLHSQLEQNVWLIVRLHLMFDAHDQIDYSVNPLPWDYELCDAEKFRKLMSRRDMVDAWQNCRIIMWDNVSDVDYIGLTEFQRGEAAMMNGVVTEALLDTTNQFCAFGVVGDDELTTYLAD